MLFPKTTKYFVIPILISMQLLQQRTVVSCTTYNKNVSQLSRMAANKASGQLVQCSGVEFLHTVLWHMKHILEILLTAVQAAALKQWSQQLNNKTVCWNEASILDQDPKSCQLMNVPHSTTYMWIYLGQANNFSLSNMPTFWSTCQGSCTIVTPWKLT